MQLMDALKADLPFMNERLPSVPVCFEIGCGSGIISTYLSMLRAPRTALHFASDINPKAAAIAHQTMTRNHVKYGDVVLTDLMAAFTPRLMGKVDVLMFNPPYVPSPADEMKGEGISRAWAGGDRGREVLDRLLPAIATILSARGVFYLVVLHPVNNPAEIISILATHGFAHHSVVHRRAGIERLEILRFYRALATDHVDNSIITTAAIDDPPVTVPPIIATTTTATPTLTIAPTTSTTPAPPSEVATVSSLSSSSSSSTSLPSTTTMMPASNTATLLS